MLAGADPETILSSMDAVLVSERDSDEVFATVSMVRVDPSRQTARFWLAGHPLPVILDGGVAPVPDEAAGTALGIVDGGTWPGFDIPLHDRNRRDALHRRPDRGLRRARRARGAGGGRRLGEDGMQRLLSEPDGRRPGVRRRWSTPCSARCSERNGGELTDDVAVLLLAWSDRA